VGLSFLLKLYTLTGRQKDAADVRNRIEADLDAMKQRDHAWAKQLFDAWIPEDDFQISSPTTMTGDDAAPPAYQLAQNLNEA
jgi:hypothetical protein